MLTRMGQQRDGRLFPLLASVLWWTVCGWSACAPAGDTGVSLVFAGDVLLDRGVARVLDSAWPERSLADVATVTSRADIAFCNLECPLTERERFPKVFSFAGNPAYVGVLKRAGFSIVSLANNHTLDCGKAGLLETMEILRRAGIAFCGAAGTAAAARSPTILVRRGLRIGFLAYSDFPPEGVVLLPDRPAIAVLDDETVAAEIRAARQQVDLLVVSFHWGWEYQPQANARQRRLAAEAGEAGADIVVGHHPHVLQPVEVVSRRGRRCLVVYSLGNFIFDSGRPEVRETALVECVADRTGVRSAKKYPMAINDCFPRREGGPVTIFPVSLR